MIRTLAIAVAAAIVPWRHGGAVPGNNQALGTERVLGVDAKTTRGSAASTFHHAAAAAQGTGADLRRRSLARHHAEGSRRAQSRMRACHVLPARQEAEPHPELARRALAEGHSVGHHTYSHPAARPYALRQGGSRNRQSIEEDEYAVYGQRRSEPITPFFRFPGLPRRRPCSIASTSAASWVFGAMSGPAIGTRCRRNRNCS
ncbi:MAG: polysaccharide deacetylase family protein [Pseudolabrys sp.]